MLSPAEEAHAAHRQLLRQRGGKEETARLMGLVGIVAQKVLVVVLEVQLGRYARRLCVLACDGLLVQYDVFVVEGARLLPPLKAATNVGSYGCDPTTVHKHQPAFASFCCLSTTRCAADRHFWRLNGVFHRKLLILFVLIRSCSRPGPSRRR